ncbi:unnamed protein product [Phaedon cochleariae]|uniref:Uncharacterized protein n=1 Tax=Phaedon cochleariae TaxID=80249 RepID=A0A9N9SGR8_PHACE|nr:unnamed protein product [Phaedon cochleariae]
MAQQASEPNSSGVSFQEPHFQLLMSQLSILTNGMNDVRALLTEQTKKIDGCIANVTNLKQENDKLQSKVKDLEKKLDGMSASNIYAEFAARNLREKNIIIYGLDESSDDLINVSVILTELNPSNTPKPSKVTRLGKPSSQKRPLKVEFSCREEAIGILSKKSKLSLKSFSNVKIKNDYTPKQREELAKIYQEFDQRKANGESLRIKFIFGQPTIVPGSYKRPREEDESPNKNVTKIVKPRPESSKNSY